MALIYHLAIPGDWEHALDKEVYVPPHFEAEGFIHCSTEAQLLPSAEKHFKAENELVVLEMSEKHKQLRPILKWEPSRDGELFPHLYGKLPILAVYNTRMLFRNKAGVWEFD